MGKVRFNIKALFQQKQITNSIEDKAFGIVALAASIISFISVFVNNIVANYAAMNFIFMSLGVVFLIFAYLSYFRGITKPLTLPFHLLVAFVLTIGWFYYQGIEGTVPLYFMPVLFLLIYTNPQKNNYPLLAGFVILSIALVFFHYWFPEKISSYSNDKLRILNISISFVITLAVIGCVALILKRNFEEEHAKAEQKNKELELSETRLKRAELVSKIGNWELHLDSQMIIASDGASKIFGLENNIFELAKIKEFPLPEYSEMLDLKLKNLIEKNEPYDIHFRIKTIDTGEIKDIHSIAIYNSEKRIVLGVIQDITERLRAELAFRESQSLLANAITIANLGPWEYDVEKDCFTFNDSFYSLFRTNVKEVGSYTMSAMEYANRFVHPEDAPMVGLETRKAIEANETSFFREVEHRIIYADGEIGYIKVRFTLVKDENGKTVKTYGINQDITEQIQHEKILKENAAFLHELNAAKDKFFSIIAHDLKNPFNSILGLSNMLIEQIGKKDFDGIEEYAGIIQKSSQNAMDLLSNLLEWARSQTGKIVFSPEPFEINDLVNNTINLLEDSARQKSIGIYKKMHASMNVYADKSMISSILRNLISNAIKFTHVNGEIIVSVDQQPDQLIVTVSDNGVGIKKETIDKLFRIDQNFSTYGTQNESGTGLGLILCKEFIEKHGGKIWLESTPGKGSKFHFSIPSAEKQQVPEA